MALAEKIAVVESRCEALSDQEVPEELVKLERDIDSFAESRDQLQQLLREVQSTEVMQTSFKKLFGELREAHRLLKEASSEYEELHVPVQYEESAQKKLFEKCMGLQFRITEDHAISLVFTNLHPDNPGQRFTITLDVEKEGGHWNVVNLDPAVHGVRVLLNELNKTQNLTQFCKDMRKKFKESIINTN